ncbi:MAG: SpoIID/LytB domain-containing protein [Tychonema bourrellyi B0820]|uniref:Sporulation protein n=1 Tax=Tychonema bourrellyi FEM_GT703 TaxID=2040638 RepID=A0A2G4F0M8_9CYAN|nr:SpoIID/LytB domain-containing protein [Tychonema bourrellyi]MDQ2097011.1 SpoIID/LytB domain-containing protein [Tychonema bourrellyi B0820]PHX55288.1 sporulation protein [Tychonema bourrellyi FEM_GT703]
MQPRVFFASVLSILGKRYFWISLVFSLAMVAPAQAALILRVAVQEGASQLRVGSSTKAAIRDGSGRNLGELTGNSAQSAQLRSGKVAIGSWAANQIWIEPVGNGYVWIGDRWYRGRTLLIPQKSGLTAVNYVDIEQYLYSVLGAEMSGNWPQEALKAQAVAARSYAIHQRLKSETDIYDVDNTQSSQVYKGLQTESSGTYAAVDATAGQVLTYNSQIILAVFHSASGGHTENVEDVWTEPLPYLRAVPDFDQGAPVYQWKESFTRTQISNKISGVGNVISMKPERTTRHGSVLTMKVVGDGGSRVMSGADLRRVLNLRSTRFTVIPQYGIFSGRNGDKPPTGFEVAGKGFGHAVGMSQWGAYNLARQGYGYQQILLHYYRGTSLARIAVQ